MQEERKGEEEKRQGKEGGMRIKGCEYLKFHNFFISTCIKIK